MAYYNEIQQDGSYISSWKHNNPIPESLKQLTVEEFELLLRLASESLQSLRESVHSFKFQDVLTKKLDTKQKEHEKEFNKHIIAAQKLHDTHGDDMYAGTRTHHGVGGALETYMNHTVRTGEEPNHQNFKNWLETKKDKEIEIIFKEYERSSIL